MTRYSLDVFLHITGAIAVFAGYGSLLLAVTAMRRAARSEQIQGITSSLLATRKIGAERISVIDVVVIAGVLMIGVTGLDMALTFHLTQAPWVDVATGSFILLAPIGPLVVNPRLHRIADAAAVETGGPVSSALRSHLRDPLLTVVMGASLGILIGLVFLMTTKPDLVVSLVAMAIALAAGLALGWSITRRSA
jgi:uncharacterized MnhB-related membrane protein